VKFKIVHNTPVVLTNLSCLLGESPVWDAARNRILWADILGGEIHQYFPGSGNHRVFKAGQLVGSFALCTSGSLVAALENGFAIVNLDNESLEWLTDPEADRPDNRFNDGKCDPAGRFWAGTMSRTGKKGEGNLYALEGEDKVDLKLSGVSVSNGLAWSPDHTRFYFIDTPQGKVDAFDFDIQTGNLSNKRTAVVVPSSMGKPDGMTVDREGMLWIALWNGWAVMRCDPFTGELLAHIRLPVAQVTSCTFGGSDLQDLYITTAKIGLSLLEVEQQPSAGAVFVLKDLGINGLPAVLFKD